MNDIQRSFLKREISNAVMHMDQMQLQLNHIRLCCGEIETAMRRIRLDHERKRTLRIVC